MARFYWNSKTKHYDSPVPLDKNGNQLEEIPTSEQTVIMKGWSPDKERRKQEWHRKNPHGTSIKEYRDIIDKNTERALNGDY